ncbi:MAG: transporter substrate-binding protein [Ramlibacter sp.]|nr:transporter substrate-binding protein [Ramlibacter sp.]
MRSITLAAATLFAAAAVMAQTFPSRPIHIVVPNPPGGTVELVARSIAPALEALGQPVVVELKPGGNSIIGLDSVARASPDGHTLVMATTALATTPLLTKLPFDGMNAFVPVAGIASTPNIFAVHPSLAVNNLAELVAMARKAPLNVASSTPASAINLAAARFKLLSQGDLNLVPYQGGVQSVQAVVAGHAPVVFAPVSDALPHIASGRLRAIAVSSAQRQPLLGSVPTIAESGYAGFQAVQWFGVAAPAGTPKAVIDKLAAAILGALENPEVRDRFAALGIQPMPLGPAAFGEHMRAESKAFAEVIRATGIKAE